MAANHTWRARVVPAARIDRLLPLLTATSDVTHASVSPLDGRTLAEGPQ